MSTLDIRDVLDGITERLGNPIDENLFLYLEFDMNKYLKSWGNYEVLWSIEGFVVFIIIYLLALYGILRCAAMILYANLEFLLYCFIPTIASLFWCIFVYIYIYIYIYILPLCCMPHLLVFLRCSLAFVILPVSTLLVFMPCFQNLAFPFITPHRQKTPWSTAYP